MDTSINMTIYVVLDESGNYKNKKERYFVVAGYLAYDLTKIVSEHRICERQIKILSQIPLKDKIELKACRINQKQKSIFIRGLLELPKVKGIAVVIDKNHDTTTCSENVLYNYLVKSIMGILLKSNINKINEVDTIEFKLDNRNVSVGNIYVLQEYLRKEFPEKIIYVNYLDSSSHREIQMADYIANLVYSKFNYPGTSNSADNNRLFRKLFIYKFPYVTFGQ